MRTLSQECERARQEAAHEAERLQATAERATSDHGRQVAALEQRLADLVSNPAAAGRRCDAAFILDGAWYHLSGDCGTLAISIISFFFCVSFFHYWLEKPLTVKSDYFS